MNKNYLIAGVLLILIFVGSFLFLGKKGENLASVGLFSAPKIEVKIADPKAFAWAQFPVAIKKGFFEKNNLIVNVVPVQTGDESLKAMISDSADIALAGIIPFSFLAIEHPEARIIAQTASARDNQIIANKESGILNPKDLKGKTIGYAKTTASDIGVEKFLKSNGLTEKDVRLVNLKPLAMPQALLSGEIDAYSIWEPHIVNGQKAIGDIAIVFGGEENVYTWHPAIVVKDSIIKSKGEALSRFLKAWKEAEEYLKTNREESMVIVAEYTKIPVESVRRIWGEYDFRTELSAGTEKIFDVDLNWANSKREKVVSNIPKSFDLIDYSVIKNVK
jgi:NitT/TauT family transport system substrate-binding protein